MTNLDLMITGMTCANCALIVERALMQNDAVRSCAVSVARSTAHIDLKRPYEEPELSQVIAQLVECVQAAHYGAAPLIDDIGARFEARNRAQTQERTALRRRCLISLVLCILMMVIAMVLPVMHAVGSAVVNVVGAALTQAHIHTAINLIQLVIATIIQFVCAAPFYQGAYAALRSRVGTMDVLVATGTSIAFGYACYITFSPAFVGQMAPFETSAMLVTFVLIGKVIEARARQEVGQTLANLQPKEVCVERLGVRQQVPVDQVQVGDCCVIRAGERVAVDGRVISGESFVDESMVTGESQPVYKRVDDQMVSGTINGDGLLVVEATGVGRHTLLARIMALVDAAQSNKPQIQQMTDKVSAVFVPLIGAVSVITFVSWYLVVPQLVAHGVLSAELYGSHTVFEKALLTAVSVVVVACPCALGLATPTAIMVALSVACQQGVVVRDGTVLERAGLLNKLFFDKTGTLMRGRPEVSAVHLHHPSYTSEEVLSIAKGLEEGSTHPLASAVRDAYTRENLNKKDLVVQENKLILTRGMTGRINNDRWAIGNARLIAEYLDEAEDAGVDIAPMEDIIHQELGAHRVHGDTLMWLANNRQGLVATLVCRMEVSPSARPALNALRASDIEVAVLTGDNPASAQRLADELDLDHTHVLASCLPHTKQQEIARAHEQGRYVGMVGDGINDAPALAASDLSFAMGEGTDVALEVADVTLLGDDLRGIITTIELSHATMRKIRQNLWWALGYNLVLIPLACLGFMRPELSGACMAASSIGVVCSSLMLKRFVPSHKR